MIINKDECKNRENGNIDNINNEIKNNKFKEELSFENLSGEEEDEDDLLKSESESNNSFKSIHGINELKNEQNLIILNPNNINHTNKKIQEKSQILEIEPCTISDKKEKSLISNKDEKIENKKTNNSKDVIKDAKENKEKSSDSSSSSNKPRILERRNDTYYSHSDDDNEEESKTNELEEEFDDDEEDEENDSESINPYNKYSNSERKLKNYIYYLEKGNYIYEKNTNKYYIYLGSLYQFKDTYLYINNEIEKKKRKDEILSIINEQYIIKSYSDINDINSIKNKILDSINQPDFLITIKEGEKESKNEIIIFDSINKSIFQQYSFYKNVKIYYLNYLNKKFCLNVPININWKIKDFFNYFVKLYHIPNDKPQNQSSISIFIKNQEISLINNKKKFFIPSFFDYEKDYIIILEKENMEIINIDLGSQNKRFNFCGKKIPHIVFSSYNNFCVESIIVSNQLNILECDIYEFKEKYYFNLERNLGKYNFKKAKEILLSGDWQKKCKYLTSIKSINSSIYKNNEDAKSFSIWPKIILYHDKSYVFLITSPDLRINVFNSGSADQGLFIISNDDKAILNGFNCKIISDLSLDETILC